MDIRNNSEMIKIIKYLICGFLAFLINFGSYCFFVKFLHFEILIANVICWIITVLFAYLMNRKIVFLSENNNVSKEMFLFFSERVFTLLLEELILWIGLTLSFDDVLVKLLAQVVVVVGNYVISRFIVFKKS